MSSPLDMITQHEPCLVSVCFKQSDGRSFDTFRVKVYSNGGGHIAIGVRGDGDASHSPRWNGYRASTNTRGVQAQGNLSRDEMKAIAMAILMALKEGEEDE